MMQAGLVSVTFKPRPCEEVIHYARVAELKAIEWHGQNHVPHGDLETARRIGQSTRAAGLSVAAYGSYYVLGQSESMGLAFDSVLQTAVALETRLIRVWAGDRSPENTTADHRIAILEDARRIADIAAKNKIQIVLEFHRDTLTQTGESCVALLNDMKHPNVGTYWQPAPALDLEQNLTELRRVLPWLVGLHVFHWGPTHLDRHALVHGESDWDQYLAVAQSCPRLLNVLLEFVKDGRVEQFYEDAATLHRLLAKGIAYDRV